MVIGKYKGIYNDVKHAILNTLTGCFNGSSERVDIYAVPFQNIPTFPAISVEFIGRTKEDVGVGGTYRMNIEYAVWIYTDVLDSEEAEEWCAFLAHMTEQFLLANKTLGGTVSKININGELQFGKVEQGENNFLQGARIPLVVTTQMMQIPSSC